ncbi:Hypothetical protein Tcol_1073 [Trichococcus collinsii]|nr:Hypothetical protein Tcol_1073 [Trichococcus collinsii]
MGTGPPMRGCSLEDRLLIRAQLRLGSGNRRKMNTEEPTSVEKGAHRRKAPVPIRGYFAGADASAGLSPPTSHRSSEDRIRPRAQLRPAFACRRKMNTEEPNSFERGAHRRKAPAPVRVCFAGAEASAGLSPPTSHRSSEDRIRPHAQLRPAFACRRKMNTEEPNSVENGAHRRKAPAPVRVCFAGADASAELSPPTSHRSQEDRIRPHAQLRPESGNRRAVDHRNPSSAESAFRRSWAAPTGRHRKFVQKVFNIIDTFPFTNYTYRGIIISIQPKPKNFVK